MKCVTSLCLMTVFIVNLESSCRATEVLDQIHQIFASTRAPAITTDQLVQFEGQSFTAGKSGLLTTVGIQVARNNDLSNQPDGPLTIHIMDTVSGVPTNILGTVMEPLSSFPAFTFNNPTFVDIDVSSLNISVEPGDVLAIMAANPGGGNYNWHASDGGNPYPGGQRWRNAVTFGPPWNTTTANDDMGFRTFISIPEPSSLVCLTVALGTCLLRRSLRLA